MPQASFGAVVGDDSTIARLEKREEKKSERERENRSSVWRNVASRVSATGQRRILSDGEIDPADHSRYARRIALALYQRVVATRKREKEEIGRLARARDSARSERRFAVTYRVHG